MRVRRNDHVPGSLGGGYDGLENRFDSGDGSQRRVSEIHAKIGGHLIVAAAPRVQTGPRGAGLLDQPSLDVHVDVFKILGELELPGRDLGANFFETGADLLFVLSSDDSRLGQGCCPRKTAADIFLEQSPVVSDRRVELAHRLVELFFESS